MKTWNEESLEVLAFHEAKQLEHGKGKSGRPDTLTGKRGWGIDDTAKALGRSVRSTFENIHIGQWLRENPHAQINHKVDVLNLIKGKSPKKLVLEDLLKTLRTQIIILESDKRTKKIGATLREALKNYEG